MNLLRILAHMLLVRPLLHLVFGVHIAGRENLRGLSRFIMVANHNSHLDVLLLYAAIPLTRVAHTYPVAARDYFGKHPILYRCIGWLMQPVWVDRSHSNRRAIKEVRRRLDEGASLIFFPEGTRGEPGELQPFRNGIGLIVRRHEDVPLVPVYLEGAERAFPRGAAVPIPVWTHVTISPPLALRGDRQAIVERLHNHMESVAKQSSLFRHRRSSIPDTCLCVAVIGVDGSGKSTLARQLATHCKGDTCLLGDRLELFADGVPRVAQPLLMEEVRGWVHRRAKRARNLKSYKLPKLMELLLRDRLLAQIERWYRPHYIFTDGAPLLNAVAWSVLYHPEELGADRCARALRILTGQEHPLRRDPIFKQFPELAALRNLRLNRMHWPDAVIFLDTHIETAMSRIMNRGEAVQAHENVEKLTRLRSAYERVCGAVANSCPVCVLNGDQPIEEIEVQATRFIQRVRKHETD